MMHCQNGKPFVSCVIRYILSVYVQRCPDKKTNQICGIVSLHRILLATFDLQRLHDWDNLTDIHLQGAVRLSTRTLVQDQDLLLRQCNHVASWHLNSDHVLHDMICVKRWTQKWTQKWTQNGRKPKLVHTGHGNLCGPTGVTLNAELREPPNSSAHGTSWPAWHRWCRSRWCHSRWCRF